MTWVSWRLQRTETMIAVAILGLLAALLIPTGITMANAYHQDGLSSCLALNAGPTCAQRIGDFQSRFQALNVLANWFTLIPGLIGVLLAALSTSCPLCKPPVVGVPGWRFADSRFTRALVGTG
jgi:hypothetical protein